MEFLKRDVTGFVNNQNMNNDTGSPKTKNFGINKALSDALNATYDGMLIDGMFFDNTNMPYAGVLGTENYMDYNAYQCTLANSATANAFVYVACNSVTADNPYSTGIPDEYCKFITVEDELFRAMPVDIDDVLEVTRSIVDVATPDTIDVSLEAWYTLVDGKLTYTTTEPTEGYAFKIIGMNKYSYNNRVLLYNISDENIKKMDLIQIVRVS